MRSLALGLLVLLLAGCQMTASTATSGADAVRVACEAFRPITYSSSQDSPATIREIRAHNSAWVELCETRGEAGLHLHGLSSLGSPNRK